MKIQNSSFAIQGCNNMHMKGGVTATDNAHMNNKLGKAGNHGINSISLSPNSQFDKMTESIREQIQRVQENDRYDADTKKGKIEELENQLREIEKAKAEQLSESVFGSNKKNETNKVNKTGNNIDEKSNDKGVSVDISIDAKALLEADNSLKNLSNANSMKVRLEGESNVLASEIKIDKGRGVNTAKKEEQLSKIQEGIEKSMENIGETIKDINNAANDISVDTGLTSGTKGESHTEDDNITARESSEDLENISSKKTDADEKTPMS